MKKLSKVCCLFTCLCLTACGDITFGLDMDVTRTLKKANEPIKSSYEDVNSEKFKAFLDKFTNFSLRFNDAYLSNYDDKSSNSAISPLSLFYALAMTSECTAGNSQKELLDSLNFSTVELRENLPILYSIENVTHYNYNYENGKDDISGIRDLNNSIWFNSYLNKNEETLDVLARFYNSDCFETEFTKDNFTANKEFSNYIKKKTHGLIDQDFQIDPSTMLILLNTLYLKDVWNSFGKDLSLTNNTYDFIKRDGKISKTMLMKGNYISGRVLRKESFSSFFTRTYNGLNIHFLTPNDNYKLEDVFIKENINLILDKNNYEYRNDERKIEYYTSTYFPSFEASCDKDLVSLLKYNFNINDMFDSGKANFSRVSQDNLYVSEIRHTTKLKVEQKGIEGAAITAVMTPGSSNQPVEEYEKVYETFIVDKSFGYVVTDNYGVTLFSGIVNKI